MGLKANEAERLASPISFGVLDKAFEPSFDRTTRFAAAICGRNSEH